MNQLQMTAHEQSSKVDGNIGLFEMLIFLAEYKKRLLVVPFTAAVISAGGSMALPNVYEATTKLLPPQQSQSSTTALLSQLGGAAGFAAGMGIKNSNDLYVGMLKSRTVADRLIAKFNLKKVYDTDSLDAARIRLEKNTTISAGKDGLISIQVEDKNKQLVAPLANAYVNELTQLNKVLAVTEASQRRMFYEQQLEKAKDNLASVEGELKGALDRRGVISVDTESRAMLETVARLRAQASVKEIQLNSMAAFVTRDNPQYKQVSEELASLRGELAKLENGRGAEGGDNQSPSAGGQSGFQNAKLLRDVKYYQMLYELLAKQYEVARLDEAKDPSIIQVLDPAAEPERKAKPRRVLIVALATIAGLLLAVLSAFMSRARRNFLKSEEGRAQWHEFKSLLARK
ncbi:GNVR domain-containing protein [Massilia sp. BSC265]|uniref:GumC family protein n=1 Tax=Massilia sp. BSC265 TaxID=1549812 RepID=UPI00055C403F|nr:GNVR domain-containing protein [Massilia sp. BSC265]